MLLRCPGIAGKNHLHGMAAPGERGLQDAGEGRGRLLELLFPNETQASAYPDERHHGTVVSHQNAVRVGCKKAADRARRRAGEVSRVLTETVERGKKTIPGHGSSLMISRKRGRRKTRHARVRKAAHPVSLMAFFRRSPC